MDIKTRLTRCCGKPIGGYNCHDGMRCTDCFDKFEGWREIERLREALQSIIDDYENAEEKDGWLAENLYASAFNSINPPRFRHQTQGE